MLTNFSKGELSPLIEGRPDLAAYFEGMSVGENFQLLRQGGLKRRPGTRFVAEAKFNDNRTLLVPFESSVGDAYILEMGEHYIRFFKNGVRVETSPGVPYELVSPYEVAQLSELHYTQSVDVMFMFHPDVPQQKLSRVADTTWFINTIRFNPPPSIDDDIDISEGTITLTPAAATGTGVNFTASVAGVFLAADVGRQIISLAGRATITSVIGGGQTAVCDIIDEFANPGINIPPGLWFMRLAPQTSLDPHSSGPVGTAIQLVAAVDAFRPADVGRVVGIYGGLVQIGKFVSPTTLQGILVTPMVDTNAADPAATPAGAWTLETISWSFARGFPRTGEFFQGRLGQAATRSEPNTLWLSRSDDYENYGRGTAADDAITYPVATKQLNRIEWLGDNKDLFLGTMGSEHRVSSGNSDNVIGGDVIPLVRRISGHGSAPMQPISIGSRIVFLDRSLKKLWALLFNLEEDNYDPIELTSPAEHITSFGLKQTPIGFTRNPDPLLYFIRQDGQLVVLTYYYQEKVIGFMRYVTDGTFGAVGIVSRSGQSDLVMVTIDRDINGTGHTYIEAFEDAAPEFLGRAWFDIHVDSAKLYDLNGVPTTVFAGLDHLEGETVHIVADGNLRSPQVVSGGLITLEDPASEWVEIGLPYVATATTMRPAVEGQMVEGVPRIWKSLSVRLKDTRGGKLQGQFLPYPLGSLNVASLYTGDVKITPGGNWDVTGKITVVQDQPYPMTLLAIYGEVMFGDHA